MASNPYKTLQKSIRNGEGSGKGEPRKPLLNPDTSKRAPGKASACCEEILVDLRTRWITMAPTTVVMKEAQIRNASLCLRAVVDEKSNMKFWFILVLFHMKRLHPYKNIWRLRSATMLHK